MEKDHKALNAIGYIFYTAPEIFDKDMAKLNLFGSIRKDVAKAFKSFKKAAGYGSVNAKYNLGSIYLSDANLQIDDETKVQFSFT